jgi:hypothetical protein
MSKSIAQILAEKKRAAAAELPGKRKPLVLGTSIDKGRLTPAEESEPRALGMTEGESLDLTPVNADETTANWHACLNALETELCVMRDPVDSERAWLALRLSGREESPLLLKSFMLFDHPRQTRDIPF